MKDEKVLYDGRVVSKEGFRAWVYGPSGETKLANSWYEYEDLVSSGIWFSKKSDALKYTKKSDKDSKKGGK